MKTDADQSCGVCGMGKLAHDKAEFLKTINHVWNAEGELIQVKPEPPKPRTQAIVIVDAELREILLRKGVITVEDFASLRDSRPGTAGDREAGQAEGTG